MVSITTTETKCAFCGKKFPHFKHGKMKVGVMKKVEGQLLQFCGFSHYLKQLKKLKEEK